MRHLHSIPAAIAIILSAIVPIRSGAAEFFDTRAADRFLEIGVHGLVGTSTLLQNYQGTYPAITDLHMSAGFAGGAGASVTFGLRNFLALGTELNFMARHSRIAMASVAQSRCLHTPHTSPNPHTPLKYPYTYR